MKDAIAEQWPRQPQEALNEPNRLLSRQSMQDLQSGARLGRRITEALPPTVLAVRSRAADHLAVQSYR